MEQKVFYPKQLDELSVLFDRYNGKNIFVVRANKSFKNSGAENFISNLIGKDYTSFFEFNPNPQLNDLKKGIELFKKGSFDLIIAIGGGSVLDMAKLISVFAHQNEDYESLITGKNKINSKKTPLIAIPSTAGTGAEATQFAVLYIDKTKYSVAHENILPDWIYLSHTFSMTASPYLTACTGLDAFCQAVESIWSVNATEGSINFAKEAIRLVWGNLQEAVKLNDEEAKQHMLKAAYLAGKAINITKTTAPHALSYAFTSYYNIPHGHAVAITLPFFLKYNYNVSDADCTDANGAEAVKSRIQTILNELEITIENVDKVLNTFFLSIGVQINIHKLIDNFDPNIIISNVNFERLNNNPRKVTTQVINDFMHRS